MVQFFMN